MTGYALRRERKIKQAYEAEGGNEKNVHEEERECRTHGDSKWLNDSVRPPLFVDLNHVNPFVIPQTVAAAPGTDPWISLETR